MAYNKNMNVKNLLALSATSMLIACGWVDSTGRESNSAPVTKITFADGQRLDASKLNELGSLAFSVSAVDADGEVNRYEWQPEPTEQGALDQCAGVPDFNIDLAADSLENACPPTANCVVTIEQQPSEGEDVEFLIKAPELRAPVGVTYQLNAIDNDGGTGTQQSTFCLIAINEAPDALDDSFTILEGQVLTVSAQSDPVHLLTNDVQDDHVSNNELRVLPTAETAPSLTSSFSLESDGGFTYASTLIADRSAESAIDTFVYSVTDGTHISSATVTINVVAKNDPPEQTAPIPMQEIVAGIEFENDLSQYFSDAEGSTLSFAISAGALPASGALTLSATGVLSGTPEVIDEGSYTIEIIASDGSEQTKADVSIEVSGNLPVLTTTIPSQTNELGESLELNLSPFFTDPEAKALTYSVNNIYNTATIEVDELTGELVATFSSIGRYTIDVLASDGTTPPTSNRFVVVVTSANVAPVFRGIIRDRVATVGTPMTPIIAATSFSDANDDELTYSFTGTLPDGITLSAAGTLFGIPTDDGFFPGIRIIATDPLGRFARSNAFRIRVFSTVLTPVVIRDANGNNQ